MIDVCIVNNVETHADQGIYGTDGETGKEELEEYRHRDIPPHQMVCFSGSESSTLINVLFQQHPVAIFDDNHLEGVFIETAMVCGRHGIDASGSRPFLQIVFNVIAQLFPVRSDLFQTLQYHLHRVVGMRTKLSGLTLETRSIISDKLLEQGLLNMIVRQFVPDDDPTERRNHASAAFPASSMFFLLPQPWLW